ncbi:MAG: winged helix-turn-helix transcriptional regulator [Candidatus Thermoplasmatota archaeon]|nr:winged helix-turn-helix transcriptional regulator [Candidatus Thermoplasmatota archaeon]
MSKTSIPAVMLLLAVLVFASLLSAGTEGQNTPTRDASTLEILPDPEDEISPTGSPVKYGSPGSDVYFTIWVKNDHSMEQRVVLTIVDGPDWLISATGSVNVPSNSSLSARVIATIPDSILAPDDSYPILVEGTGNITGDTDSLLLIIKLDITIDHELVLTPYNAETWNFNVYPGERTFVDIMLKNLGNMKARYEMRIKEHPSEWDTQFREGDEVLEFQLDHGETGSEYRTRIMVNVPASSTPGEIMEITAISTSIDSEEFSYGKASDSVLLQFEVVKGATVTISPVDTLVKGGSYVDVNYLVHHSGVVDSVIEFAPSVYKDGIMHNGWEFLIAPADTLLIKIGETKEVRVRAIVPEGSFGYFEMRMDAISSSSDVIPGQSAIYITPRSEITLSDLVGGPFDLGEEIVLRSIVSNDGDLTTSGLVMVSGVPSGYSLKIEPAVDLSLASGEELTLTIRINSIAELSNDPFNVTLSIHAPVDDGTGQWASVAETSRRIDFRDLPNLEVRNIFLSNDIIQEGEEIFVNVTVANIGNIPTDNVQVLIYEIAWQYSNKLISNRSTCLGPGDVETISFLWNAKVYTKSIRAIVRTPEGVEDMDLLDNEKKVDVYVERIDREPPESSEENRYLTSETAAAGGLGLGILGAVLVFFGYQDLVRYPFFIALTPLYSKLRPEHLLNNRLRKRIYVYVQNHPGEHFRSILTHLDLTNGTLAHHLYTLEKEDLVRSQRDGLYRRFYPAGYQIDPDQISLTDIQQRIIDIIKERPGLSQKDISLALGLSNSTVNYNIKSMKEKGLIEVKKDGKNTRILIASEGNS